MGYFTTALFPAALLLVSFAPAEPAAPSVEWTDHVFQQIGTVAEQLEGEVTLAIESGDCAAMAGWRDYAVARQGVDRMEGRTPSDALVVYMDHHMADCP